MKLFAQGFFAMLPLWTGAIPVGLAYSLAARDAGLSLIETQLMSLTVFSAAAQISIVAMISAGMPVAIIIATGLALNIQLVLIGLSVGRRTKPSGLRRWVAAYFLTDGAYGIALTGGQLTLSRLLGAGVSMFIAWNVGTALGSMANHALHVSGFFVVDVVPTLAFLAVLSPLIRTQASVVTVVITGVAMLGMLPVMPSGLAVLTSSLIGCLAGAGWDYYVGPPIDSSPKEVERQRNPS